MTTPETDPVLYPNKRGSRPSTKNVSRRRLLAGSATAGAVATAGCLGGDGGSKPTEQPTVFVFNTGDGTVGLIDPESDELVESRSLGLSSSFPSNQYTPALTDDPDD
ncbi:MAG: hypothetical protein V5A40_15060, partial [Haloarculaceae archaeon]